MLQLIPTCEIRVGDRVMPEEYDEHLSLANYDEACAEPIADVVHVDQYSVKLVTEYGDSATFDRDDLQMVVKRDAWQRDGRDTTDLS